MKIQPFHSRRFKFQSRVMTTGFPRLGSAVGSAWTPAVGPAIGLALGLVAWAGPVGADDTVADPPTDPTAAAQAAEVSGEYADEGFAPIAEEHAVYRLQRQFREPMMMIEGVPTFDQGMALRASQTPLDKYTFNYFRIDDESLAFSVQTTVLREDPSQYIFSGVGIWYDRDTIPTARATFEGSKIHGAYETLDADGNVVETQLYDQGVPYDENRFADETFPAIHGTWYADTPNDTGFRRLTNIYRADGTMTIFSQSLMESFLNEDELTELSRSDATECAWQWTPDDDDPNQGVAAYYIRNTLMGRSRIKLIDANTFEARIVYHQSPELVGTRYTFTKAD